MTPYKNSRPKRRQPYRQGNDDNSRTMINSTIHYDLQLHISDQLPERVKNSSPWCYSSGGIRINSQRVNNSSFAKYAILPYQIVNQEESSTIFLKKGHYYIKQMIDLYKYTLFRRLYLLEKLNRDPRSISRNNIHIRSKKKRSNYKCLPKCGSDRIQALKHAKRISDSNIKTTITSIEIQA